MVNVISKICIFEECKTRPSFNFDGESNAIYCGDHKKENMIDVKSKKCLFENCIKQPNFNFEG
jgi:hypothetical protein